VDQPALVQVAQRRRHLPRQGTRLGHRQRPEPAHQPVEVLPLDQLHRQVDDARLLAGVVRFDHVGVVQAADRTHLPQEAGDRRRGGVGAGRQHLKGDQLAQPAVAGPVDHAHAAAPQPG
jgi:hypothetical protein